MLTFGPTWRHVIWGHLRSKLDLDEFFWLTNNASMRLDERITIVFKSFPDMCQDPNHLFLWVQLLAGIRKMHYLFLFSLWSLCPPFTCGWVLSLTAPKFREMLMIPPRRRKHGSRILRIFCSISQGSNYPIEGKTVKNDNMTCFTTQKCLSSSCFVKKQQQQ